MGLRECLGEQFPMPGEWWWLLRKCMLRTRQQVLQVTLGGESQVVPSHQGHQVRLVSRARSSAAMFCNACMAEQLTDRKRRGGLGSPTLRLARVCRAPPCMHRSGLLLIFYDAL